MINFPRCKRSIFYFAGGTTHSFLDNGSLRKGRYNQYFLNGGRLIGIDQLHRLDMYSNGFYPYVVTGKGSITVEVYEIICTTLAKRD